MNPIERLLFELRNLKSIISTRTFLIYLFKITVHLPEIVRTKTLVPADRAMGGVVDFTLNGTKIAIPLSDIAKTLQSHDNTPTFGGAREMYSGNPYLRAFKDEFTATTVLDLGSNRGLFLFQAAAMLRAKSAIGVEGQEFYRSAFEKSQSQNSHIDCKFTRYFKLIHPKKTADGITFGEIANRHGIEKFDFVKCDIEGGEFPLFLEEPGNLEYFDNFSMETHNDMGSIDSLIQAFEKAGFTLAVTDQFGNQVTADHSHYISGSRTGDLKN